MDWADRMNRTDMVKRMMKSGEGRGLWSRRILHSRRSFLAGALAASAHRVIAGDGAGNADADPSSEASLRKAAWKRRPLILDDDGDLVYDPETLKGAESFLALRMHDCLKAGINSHAWCIMWGIARKGTTPVRYWQNQMERIPFQTNLPDPTPVVASYCGKHGIEVFGSIRMNDCHDAFGMPFPELVYPLKVQHPEMLIGDRGQKGGPADGLAAATWSGLDFAHKRVREDRLWWIENTASQYDLDGVDLNFFRMPCYFKPGEEERNMPLMTDFIRQARRRLDVIGRRRRRPVLLGVRIPGTIETCRRIGLDIEEWVRKSLVNRLLTGGGYVCYSTPAEELVQLGHRFEVPVYPCINCPANYTLGGGNFRAAASNFWWAGADGIYLWNFQYIPAPGSLGYGRLAPDQYLKLLPEIADPQELKYLDKSFAVSRRVWEQYQRASAPAPLPVDLGSDGLIQVIPIRIGDDVPGASRDGKLKEVVLRITSSGAVRGDILAVKCNDAAWEKVKTDGDNLFELRQEGQAVRQGVNLIQLTIAHRDASADKPLAVEQMSMDVRYHGG